jgi:Transglutaminase-like superfamily
MVDKRMKKIERIDSVIRLSIIRLSKERTANPQTTWIRTTRDQNEIRRKETPMTRIAATLTVGVTNLLVLCFSLAQDRQEIQRDSNAPPQVVAQEFVVPRDGMFYIEQTPAFTFKATLVDDWTNTHGRDGELHVFAPVPPQLPSQTMTDAGLFIAGKEKEKPEEVTEAGEDRRIFALHIKTDEQSSNAKTGLRLELQGTLFSRSLKRSEPPVPVPNLTPGERQQYLKSSVTMDYDDAEFVEWMNVQGLKRAKDEETMQFGHRVFMHFVKDGKFGGDTSTFESRRPSRVCKSLANDCGGLALLFVAVMRANDVPARTLFGRWAIQQTDKFDQAHVIAEFFVDKSGWVPVDIAGTVFNRPKDMHALFGNTDGQFLTFHVNTDLQPAKDFRDPWAQYLLLHWSGPGDFWKEHGYESQWNVTRNPVK